MELNKINSSGNWGKAADDLNQNFSKVNNAVEQVKNATTRNKGYFSSEAALKSAFKSASFGDIAYVGRAFPYQTWAWNGSEWVKKNDNGGQESVNLGNYYTKSETDGKFTETDAKLSELGSEVRGNNIKIIGQGLEQSVVEFHLIAGNYYKFEFANDWLLSNEERSKLIISHRTSDDDSGLIVDVKINGGDSINPTYIVKAEKSLINNRYQMLVRANEGEEVYARVVDITESVKNLMEILLLEQGGIGTKTGLDVMEKEDKRCRTVNYIAPRTPIYTEESLIWAEALYSIDTKDFVGFNNIKKHYHITRDGYLSRLVFAKDIDGIMKLIPEEVFERETIGCIVAKSYNTQYSDTIYMHYGILYDLFTSSYADSLPSSLIGRTYLYKGTSSCYLSASDDTSLKSANDKDYFIISEFTKDFELVQSYLYTTTIKIKNPYVKITALRGEIVRPTLEYGSISSGNDVDENTRKRTDFINIDSFDFALVGKNEKLGMRFYDESKEYISSAGDNLPYKYIADRGLVAKEHLTRFYPNAKYVRFIVADIYDSEEVNAEVRLLTTDGVCTDLEYTTFTNIDKIKERGIADKTIAISYPVSVNNPKSESEKYYSKALLRLPKNYSNTGNATPLVLFKTGAQGFESISTSEFNYAYYVQYLVDMGFAVFDFHSSTSKNPNIDVFLSPTGYYSAMAAYKHIVENYNVKEELFVACKSVGGNMAIKLAYSSLPVKAVGLLAPAMNPSGWCFGYTEEEQLAYAQDFGFKEGYETVLNGSRDYKRQEFKDLVQENLDALTGYQPMQLGVTNKTFGETFVNQDVYDPDVEDSFKDIIRYVPVPIKFWVAPDDTNTPIQMHRNFVKSAINGGSTAYLRELPEGTGAHHAVDNDPNALQTANITTRLGVHYNTMTTAWVELAEWFIKYGG